ncbi:MAG: YebC/PmpR family DNA-binding transcriptional regulator [Endozoicomonadaceae bacterium]|nr:YebC/PmpR family DNA-binding transcriptional regulator [Endozoicomonadaceae bacterium]
MAGHSKWANIKHRKARQDAKRGKIFTKMIRALVVSAKKGGGNIEDNPTLRTAVDKALSVNMTRDMIDRAIKRGMGADVSDDMHEITYEGYAVGGTAVLIECLTDNKNRTVSEIRHAFSKNNGNLGTDGSVAYLFERVGQLLFESSTNEDILIDSALSSGAKDVLYDESENVFEVLTDWMSLTAMKEALLAYDLPCLSAEVIMRPSNKIVLDMNQTDQMLKLIDQLEDLDDVQNVFTNAVFYYSE